MKSFKNKVAVITGAGSGIGRALAIELANAGCNIALSDVNQAGLDETRSLLGNIKVKVSFDLLNVSDREGFSRYADKVYQNHNKVNLIFNNAGVTLIDMVETVSYDDFEWLMNINFWGVVYGTKAFLPYLLKAEEGHIVNVSSLFGLMAIPSQSAYNASKFAVRGFTEALKMELVDTNVGVSCVHPGGIRTSIVDNSRINEEAVEATRADYKSFFKKQAITSADQAASIILRGVKKNQRRILVGKYARLADKIVRWFPNSYEKKLKLEGSIKKRGD